ncbi:MAG: c-type cytochrome [Chromatiaceae bacterium]|jgi:cytochrome c553|nr:c-type cytochrome [Chromatiaceae bacterium]MBP8283335.1 c-type cytochrome [Chromatiaceae bacterium]
MKHPLTRSLLVSLLALTPLTLQAEPDMERGKALNRQCALCHGFHGQGVLGGKYPRLAGLPEYYLVGMMDKYKDGTLDYQAMTVVGGLRNLSDADLQSLAAYLSDIDLAAVSPLDIPTPEGADLENGEDLFQGDCKSCHGRKAEGMKRKESPPLAGQYSEYLLRQIAMFKKKERIHANDEEDETFEEYEPQQIKDILAYISTLDDK